jgi:hypothetical protein
MAKAQNLQMRRERWGSSLASLPMPKSGATDFPYASLDEALDDAFRKVGGSDAFFKLAAKAWKTKQWRAAAERNRATRDAIAELDAKKTEEERVQEAVSEHVGE